MRFTLIILLAYAIAGYIEQYEPPSSVDVDIQWIETHETSLDQYIEKAEKCMVTPGCKSIK
jgi:hypothetical protein